MGTFGEINFSDFQKYIAENMDDPKIYKNNF